MKAKKFTFYLGIIIFLIAGCGLDNEGWWPVACLGGLVLSWISTLGCTKRELVYMFDLKKKYKDYNF